MPELTWRQEIEGAVAMVAAAHAHRSDVFKAAHADGLSYNAIAGAAGTSAAQAKRIVLGEPRDKRTRADPLDKPAKR